MPADAFFAAARQMAEQVAAQRAAHRQQTRLARNARRRARYATRPKPVRQQATVVVADEEPEPEACYCHATPMPPCGWCTDPRRDDEGGDR